MRCLVFQDQAGVHLQGYQNFVYLEYFGHQRRICTCSDGTEEGRDHRNLERISLIGTENIDKCENEEKRGKTARGEKVTIRNHRLFLHICEVWRCVCVHACVHQCVWGATCMWECRYMQLCSYMRSPERILDVFLCHSLPLPWDGASHWTQCSPFWLDWLASKLWGLVYLPSLSPSPMPGLQVHTGIPSFLHEWWGLELRSSYLQVFLPIEPPSQPGGHTILTAC